MRPSLKLLFIILLWCGAGTLMAQSKSYQYVHQGNRSLTENNPSEAEKFYQRALTLSPNDGRAHYNLGNAFLLQQRDSAAVNAYLKGASMEKNKLVKSMAYYNVGVVYQTKKKLKEAIDCYKEALRNNPADEEARYNLVLCQHQLKKQGGGNGGPKPQQNKDDKKGEDKQKQDNQSQQNQQPDKQQPPQNQMSKDNAEQLLDLSKQEEQQTREKIRNVQPRTRSLEKNW